MSAVWEWRARHYLGTYIAQLGEVDAVTFAGGIGENQGELRAAILSGCKELGIELDPHKNLAKDTRPRRVSSEKSQVEVWVMPTNEELQIATLSVGAIGASIQ